MPGDRVLGATRVTRTAEQGRQVSVPPPTWRAGADPRKSTLFLLTKSGKPTVLHLRSKRGLPADDTRFMYRLPTLTLNVINLSYTGELWRQQTTGKTIAFGYYLDPSTTNVFSTNVSAWVTSLDVSFPTGTAAAQDGTAPINQESLAVSNQMIPDWSPARPSGWFGRCWIRLVRDRGWPSTIFPSQRRRSLCLATP